MNSKKPESRQLRRQVRGAAIIAALTFTIVISILLAGVAKVSVSHYSRSVTEADYAAAIQVADAGLNYELRWISDDTGDPNRPHQLQPATGQNSAYTGSVTGLTNSSFTVYVTKTDGTGPWYAPSPMIVTSVGTYNGVKRAVQITGVRKSLFDEYALFGVDTAGLNGQNSLINGSFGTNGDITLGQGTINGEISLNGSDASLSGTTTQTVYSSAYPVNMPTVDQIANALFTTTLGTNYLKTANSNANIKTFSSSDPEFLLANAVSAGIGTSNWNLNASAYSSATRDTLAADAPGGTRYCTASVGLQGTDVLIFPPGDYYFESISLSGQKSWLIDNASGIVRIWIGGTATTGDTLAGSVVFTSSDPSKFRLFYNKCAELTVPGNSTFNGSFYGVRDGCTAPKIQSFKYTGGSTINGSVIGQNITVSGGTVINFPNNGGGADPTDFSLWFGFKDSWKEVAISSGLPVFADGTSK
jgi:Tfp pilus assembly protein PilX